MKFKIYNWKLSIFWKTFFLTIVMLLGITIIAFGLIYLFLPTYYENHILNNYRDKVESNLSALEESRDMLEEVELLVDILSGSPTSFQLKNDNDVVAYEIVQNKMYSSEFVLLDFESWQDITLARLYLGDDVARSGPNFGFNTREEFVSWRDELLDWFTWGNSSPEEQTGELTDLGFSTEEEYEAWRTESEPWRSAVLKWDNFMIRDAEESLETPFMTSFLTLEFQYETTHAGTRTLVLNIPIESFDEARNVIIDMYPIIVLFCFLFAILIAFIFSRWVATPIKKIQSLTEKMIHLEPDVKIPIHSRDEIGALSRDIEFLYNKLRNSIVTLDQELSRYSNAENKKIEFLQTVSHEMKTPLASANALLEGIIYEIPPYCENQRQYLEECQAFLDKTIQLTKESLSLSQQYKEKESTVDLNDILTEVSNLYGIIFMAKQLNYVVDVPEQVMITTKAGILNKIISNLYSNAANYTTEKGEIKVSYLDGTLSIFNTCEPLSKAEVEEIFKPLLAKNASENSTGLGLFIVKQLLRQLNIEYSFEASANQSGMVFNLYLGSDF